MAGKFKLERRIYEFTDGNKISISVVIDDLDASSIKISGVSEYQIKIGTLKDLENLIDLLDKVKVKVKEVIDNG